MTQAMKTAALVELVSSLGADPHAVSLESMRVILDNALKLARAHGYRPPDGKADGTAPRRTAGGERSAVGGDGFVIPFGAEKGRNVKDLDVGALRKWEAIFRRDVDNPERAQWKRQNSARLEMVRECLRAHGEAANHE